MERCEDIPSDDYVPQISQIGDPMGGGGGGGNYMGKNKKFPLLIKLK